MKSLTTTNTHADPVRHYLMKQPGYFSAGLREGVSELESAYLAHADQVEYSLKRYLSGERSQKELFTEIQSFLDLDESITSFMIGFSLKAVADTLIQLEAYELLISYQKLWQSIEKTFSIQHVNNNKQ